MKTIIILTIFILFISGCNEVQVYTPDNLTTTNTTTNKVALLTSFGDEKAIYIDQNNIVTIISKSGDILSKTDLNKAKPISTIEYWKSSIPAHDNDTLYARAEFIDDMIYYSYWVKNGKTYGMKPFLGLEVKLVDLPCQSGWIYEVGNRKNLTCYGKVKASLSIWKEVLGDYSLNMTVKTYY